MPDHNVALALISAAGRPLARRARTVPVGQARRWPAMSWRIWPGRSTASSTAALPGGRRVDGGASRRRRRRHGAPPGRRHGRARLRQACAWTRRFIAPPGREPGAALAGHEVHAPKGAMCVVPRVPTRCRHASRPSLRRRPAREVTGVLSFDEHIGHYRADVAVSLGAWPRRRKRPAGYAGLRRFDDEGATFILAEACPEQGLGATVMNRR